MKRDAENIEDIRLEIGTPTLVTVDWKHRSGCAVLFDDKSLFYRARKKKNMLLENHCYYIHIHTNLSPNAFESD